MMAHRHILGTLLPLLLLLLTSSLSAEGEWERVALPAPVYVSLQDAAGGRLLGRLYERIYTITVQGLWRWRR